MRRFLFGWICVARGYHVSGTKPKRYVGIDPAHGEMLSQALLQFRCVCGAFIFRNADVERGGRVPVPFTWPADADRGGPARRG